MARRQANERNAALKVRLDAALRANTNAHRHPLARALDRTLRLSERAAHAIRVLIEARGRRVDSTAQLLAALSYKSVLARGFALVRDADGLTLHSAAAVAPGTHLTLEFGDGKVGATADGEAAAVQAPAKPKQPAAPRSRPEQPGQGKLS